MQLDSTFKTRKPVCWLGERIFTKSRALVTLCSLMDMETIKCQSFNYIGVLVILNRCTSVNGKVDLTLQDNTPKSLRIQADLQSIHAE